MKKPRAPLVSIIIPVFNVAPYLREALDSAVNQTYSNLEIIIVDDGSTDGSGSICSEYAVKDKRIIVIHQQNQGLSAARNAGLDVMSGEYVSFLDPDDAYHPDYVRVMLGTMIRENPDIVVCKYKMYKTLGRMRLNVKKNCYPQATPGMYNRLSALRALAVGTINITVWNKLYRRCLWRSVRFPCGHNYEDVYTTYRIFDKCRSVFILPEPLYLNRERPGSISHTDSKENIRDKYLAFEHMGMYIASHMPDIFTEEQSCRYQQRRLNVMILNLIRLKGEDDISGELKEQIFLLGNEIGIENCNFRIKVAYHMVFHCPWLLKIIYPVYRPFRMMKWRLSGK